MLSPWQQEWCNSIWLFAKLSEKFYLLTFNKAGNKAFGFSRGIPSQNLKIMINAKNTPVVLVMAIAAFDPGSSVASPVYLHNVQTAGKT